MNSLKTRQVELIESLKAKVELETYRMARIEKLSEGVNLEAIEAALATLGLTKVREANVQFSANTTTKEEMPYIMCSDEEHGVIFGDRIEHMDDRAMLLTDYAYSVSLDPLSRYYTGL